MNDRVPETSAGGVDDELAGQLLSPEVHSDRRVTFRLSAPAANRVLLCGLDRETPLALQRQANGIWQVTTPPLEPEWYGYYFDVDGTHVVDPHNRLVKKWLSIESLVLVPGTPPGLHERQHVAHGELVRCEYESEVTRGRRDLLIYTPPGYDASGAGPECPLLILLHGYGDDESAWVEVGRAAEIVDNLIAARRIDPLIMAMPYGHPEPIELGEPFDVYAARNLIKMEQDVVSALLPALDQRFRIGPPPARAIAGLSMGGGQALAIGLCHPQHFGAVGGFSASAPQGDVDAQLPQLTAPSRPSDDVLPWIWLGCGRDDFLLERNDQFHQWLELRHISHQYRRTAGGHQWSVWRKYLAEFLTAAPVARRPG